MHTTPLIRNASHRLLALGLVAMIGAAIPAASADAHARGAHKSQAAQTVTRGSIAVKGGTATIVVDSAAAAAISGFGVSLGAVAPATVVGNTWKLPVASGEIRYMTRSATGAPAMTRITGGLLRMSGSITATRNGKSVTITDIRGELWEGMNGRIEAKVGAMTRGIDALMITQPTVDPVKKTATANVRLTGVAAAALNRALSTTAFKVGQLVGTVSITAP